MLDLKFLRENPDIVKQNIKNKFQDRKLPLVDEVTSATFLSNFFIIQSLLSKNKIFHYIFIINLHVYDYNKT